MNDLLSILSATITVIAGVSYHTLPLANGGWAFYLKDALFENEGHVDPTYIQPLPADDRGTRPLVSGFDCYLAEEKQVYRVSPGTRFTPFGGVTYRAADGYWTPEI